MNQIIQSWLKDLLNSHGFSQNTVESYSYDLNTLTNFLKKYKAEEFAESGVMHITKQEVRAWFLHKRNKGDADASVARSLSSLKNFLRYCVEIGMIADNRVIRMRSLHIGKLRLPVLICAMPL
jgi:site-specific recombinase XerD